MATHHVHVRVHIGNKKTAGAAATGGAATGTKTKSTKRGRKGKRGKRSGGRKRTPPRPKSTRNLPPGLAKYWAAKGVPK